MDTNKPIFGSGPAPAGSKWLGLWGGARLALGLTWLIAAVILFGGAALGVSPIVLVLPTAFLGVTQWLWLIPLYLHSKRAGATETAKGILVGGAITFLLNAACFGMGPF